jgi:hypothetical protein
MSHFCVLDLAHKLWRDHMFSWGGRDRIVINLSSYFHGVRVSDPSS